MKVLQINATYGNGSTGTIAKDIHELGLRNGIDMYVAYSTSSTPADKIINGIRVGNTFDHKLHATLCRINGMQGYYSHKATTQFLRKLDEIKPDIIHLHNLHSNYIHLPLLLKYISDNKIKTILTLHDCWFFTGGCFHFTSSDCMKWQKSCGNCPRKKLDFQSYFIDRSTKIIEDKRKLFADIPNLTIVGVSQWIADKASTGIFQGRNCISIHNGVDLEIFKFRKSDFKNNLGIDDDKFVVLGPATKWLSSENISLLKSLASKLGNDYAIVIFGTKENNLDLPENIKTIGFTSNRTQLAEIYSIADVFINSTYEDSLPFLNLESQACGTPVITFNNTGASETVDGICGFRVDNRDIDAMAELIGKLKSQKISINRESPRNWISQEFDLHKNYTKYLNLYREIMQ